MTPAEYIRELRVVALCWYGRTDYLAVRELRSIAARAREVAEDGVVNELMLLRLRRFRRLASCHGRDLRVVRDVRDVRDSGGVCEN